MKDITFDLKTLNLPVGTHTITVVSKAIGYLDSDQSNSVSYFIEPQQTYTVSGTWVFNEHINYAGIDQQVSFVSNGESYGNIKCMTDGAVFIYYGSKLVFGNPVDETNVSTWIDQAYRTITFDGTQIVSKEFYEWFVTNAVERQTLTFTIEGTTYTALSGMTWSEWINSSYNTDGYEIGYAQNTICIAYGLLDVQHVYSNNQGNKGLVRPTDEIINNGVYLHTINSGGSND